MPIEFGIAQHDGYKTPSEDFVVHHIFPNNYELFGVFDGHNTDYYSREGSRLLIEFLELNFQKELTTDNIVYTLNSAFSYLELLLSNGPKYGGTTVTVAVITETDIVCAHLGDSLALYFDKEGSLLFKTNDHNTSNQIEIERITKERGVLLKDSDGEIRINGKLALTRSLGDKTYKQHGVNSIPEITVHRRHKGYIAILSDSFTEQKQYSFLLEFIITNKYTIQELSSFLFSFIGDDLQKSANNAVHAQVNKFKKLFFESYYGDNTSLIFIRLF